MSCGVCPGMCKSVRSISPISSQEGHHDTLLDKFTAYQSKLAPVSATPRLLHQSQPLPGCWQTMLFLFLHCLPLLTPPMKIVYPPLPSLRFPLFFSLSLPPFNSPSSPYLFCFPPLTFPLSLLLLLPSTQIRNFITSMHDHLLQHHYSALANCGMDACNNFEHVVETSLQQCILQPLSHYIYLRIEEYFSQNGDLFQLQRSVHQGKTKNTEEMGIRVREGEGERGGGGERKRGVVALLGDCQGNNDMSIHLSCYLNVSPPSPFLSLSLPFSLSLSLPLPLSPFLPLSLSLPHRNIC